jgi:large subunit ribosomal protein L10
LAISKSRKQEMVGEYVELLQRSQGVVLATYAGLRVRQLEALRRKAREAGGELRVVKNRLARRAFAEAGLTVPDGALAQTTLIGFALEDIPGLARVIVDAGREMEFLRVKGGVVEGVSYGARQMEMLAELPALPVLRGRLLGVIQAPAGRVAGALAGTLRQLARVFQAYSESGAGA